MSVDTTPVRGAATAWVRRHRARISAPVGVGQDEYGHEHTDGYHIRYDALPCHAWLSTEKTEQFNEDTQGAVEVLRLICPRDADVDVTCVVDEVVDRNGRPVFSDPARVLGVSRRAEHIVVTARAVSRGRV